MLIFLYELYNNIFYERIQCKNLSMIYFNELRIIYNVDWAKDILRFHVEQNFERLQTLGYINLYFTEMMINKFWCSAYVLW